MHENDILHGDLRPRNIVYTDSTKSDVLFIDWDDARYISDLKEQERKGTLEWGGEPVTLEELLKLDLEFMRE
jgi:serine/threonine protein kinase